MKGTLETKGFHCFHFIPEGTEAKKFKVTGHQCQNQKQNLDLLDSQSSSSSTLCCLLVSNFMDSNLTFVSGWIPRDEKNYFSEFLSIFLTLSYLIFEFIIFQFTPFYLQS